MKRRCPNGFREFLCCALCCGEHNEFWAGTESVPPPVATHVAPSATSPVGATSIPHPHCRTPDECRREQICLDAWWCSSRGPDEAPSEAGSALPADNVDPSISASASGDCFPASAAGAHFSSTHTPASFLGTHHEGDLST
jgi:hypothetical protein